MDVSVSCVDGVILQMRTSIGGTCRRDIFGVPSRKVLRDRLKKENLFIKNLIYKIQGSRCT